MMIRPEIVEDCAEIGEVLREAFGQGAEAILVERLRAEPGFDPTLSLVALGDGRIAGHALFSPIGIVSDTDETPALGLAPIGVRPAYQRQGIGSALIGRGLEACEARSWGVVVVLGEPQYYARFGFQRAGDFGILAPFDVPDGAFMVKELVTGALTGVRGMVRYSEAFSGL
jgi:putative acetyltransferase